MVCLDTEEAETDNMRVTFYHRRPQGSNFSIERLFADVQAAMPEEVDLRVEVSRFPSKGVWGRVYNVIEAIFRQGEINHITGDVHFLSLLLRKKNTLLTIADLVSLHRLRGLRRSIFFFFWYWLPIRRSALVTVISNSTKEELLRHVKVDQNKVRVVYCPVSAAFQLAPKEFNRVKPVILQVGTGPNKNLERVAEALQGISCYLRVIGRLSYRQTEALRKLKIEYSAVSTIPDEQIVEEYRRCDLLVFISTYEGFGLPIVEAQATGRPVVTSNTLSMPEVGGGAACLVDPFDVASIREGILGVISNPAYRNELVRRGIENVKRFRADLIAAQYVDIYKELLDHCDRNMGHKNA